MGLNRSVQTARQAPDMRRRKAQYGSSRKCANVTIQRMYEHTPRTNLRLVEVQENTMSKQRDKLQTRDTVEGKHAIVVGAHVQLSAELLTYDVVQV